MEIDLRRSVDFGALENLPEEVQTEIDGHTEVVGQEGLVVPRGEGVKAVEEDDDGEEDEGSIGEEGLERRLEDQRVAVNTLGFEGAVEADVCDTDRTPGEDVGDGGQVLEPNEGDVGTVTAGEIGEEGDGDGDEDTVDRDTTGN